MLDITDPGSGKLPDKVQSFGAPASTHCKGRHGQLTARGMLCFLSPPCCFRRKQGSPLAHRGSAREAGAVPCLVQQRHSPVAMTARKCVARSAHIASPACFRMPSELFPPVHAAPCICVGLPLRMARRPGVNGCGLRRAAALVKREDLPGAPSLLRGWACRVAEGDEAFTFLFRKAPT